MSLEPLYQNHSSGSYTTFDGEKYTSVSAKATVAESKLSGHKSDIVTMFHGKIGIVNDDLEFYFYQKQDESNKYIPNCHDCIVVYSNNPFSHELKTTLSELSANINVVIRLIVVNSDIRSIFKYIPGDQPVVIRYKDEMILKIEPLEEDKDSEVVNIVKGMIST